MGDRMQIMASMLKAVNAASELVLADFNKACADGYVEKEHKPSTTALPDFVTKTDKAAEDIICDILERDFPNIQAIGEERGGTPASDRYFLIDPLDGTSNFASLRDYFSICAAYIENNEVVAAAVADPCRSTVVHAVKGVGAFLGNKRLMLSKAQDNNLRETQLECELNFAAGIDTDCLGRILSQMSGLRKSGSTALDLANLAQGRKIMCWADNLKPYDVAAGLLIAREAGYVVTAPNGTPATHESSAILAGAPNNHTHVLRLMHG